MSSAVLQKGALPLACAFALYSLASSALALSVEPYEAQQESKMARCEHLRPAQPDYQERARGGFGRPTQVVPYAREATTADAMVPRSVPPSPPLPSPAPSPVSSAMQEHNTERYAHYDPNPIKRTAQDPVSTFSIDVDTGSYANVRRFLDEGRLPPADAVRVEEIVNYFSYHWGQPADGQPFAVHTTVVDSPWKSDAKLLRIGLKAKEVQAEKLPPANLVFLIDTSGSMATTGKIDLAQKTVCYFAAHLRKQDTLTLITYSGYTRELLKPTAGDQFDAIYKALEKLYASGSTAGESAIRMAYESAEKNFKQGGINRILLATDGDFNVGVSDVEALKTLVAEKRKSGISLSTLGYGMGNYNDHLMEQIADAGNGNYSYIDQPSEAKKVLVRQLSSTLATVAQDVKIQIEFNPATVKEYRLVGYENRVLREEDFNNDRVDAGDIGAGHSVTAFYEFVPQGAKGWLEESRYQSGDGGKPAANTNTADEYAYIKLRYKPVENGRSSERSSLMETKVPALSQTLAQTDSDTRFAIAAATYAQALKGGEYNGTLDWSGITRMLDGGSGVGHDPYGERKGFVELVDKAAKLETKRP